jgi:hypothetical protein
MYFIQHSLKEVKLIIVNGKINLKFSNDQKRLTRLLEHNISKKTKTLSFFVLKSNLLT